MSNRMNHWVWLVALAAGLATGACRNHMMETDDMWDFVGQGSGRQTTLMSTVPSPGAVGVATDTTIAIRFSRSMAAGMEAFVALHPGGLGDELLPMRWAWSSDRTVLVGTPLAALRPATHYLIHVGGGMTDAHGAPLAGRYAMPMGATWVTGGMMSGIGSMMGQGWADGNGGYGVVFDFTTA